MTSRNKSGNTQGTSKIYEMMRKKEFCDLDSKEKAVESNIAFYQTRIRELEKELESAPSGDEEKEAVIEKYRNEIMRLQKEHAANKMLRRTAARKPGTYVRTSDR